MKSCPTCSKEMADTLPVCPFCGARVSEPVQRTLHSQATPLRRHHSVVTSARRVEAPPPLESVAASSRTALFWFLLLVVAAGGVAAFFLMRPVRLPTEMLEASAADAVLCQGRPTCVLVYVAPRHRASQKAFATIDELREKWADSPEIGFSVVVGADQPSALKGVADRLGGETFYDPNRLLLTAADARILPAWFVIGPEGKVKRHVDGTYFPLPEHLKRLGLGNPT